MLEKKLFYSSFLRYMIVSNLKLNYTAWAFLISHWSYKSATEGIKSTLFLLSIFGICIWPLFIIIFMLKNQSKLEDKTFTQRWGTLYQGIHKNKIIALIYNAVFCLRRFEIVLVNMFFSPGFPLSNFD